VELAKEVYQSVDSSCLEELRELTSFDKDPRRFNSLITAFLDSLDPQIASMRATLEKGDTAELADLAHGLKGAAASIGAIYLAHLCAGLEEICARMDLKCAGASLQQIESEVFAVRWLLEHEALGLGEEEVGLKA
jgi:HPt (histidine-containing phosphotransfer) domain-containing protein